MDKDPFNVNNSAKIEELEKENKDKKDKIIRELADLLLRKKLNINYIVSAANDLKIATDKLIFQILAQADLDDEFYDYHEKSSGKGELSSSREFTYFDFIETFQSESVIPASENNSEAEQFPLPVSSSEIEQQESNLFSSDELNQESIITPFNKKEEHSHPVEASKSEPQIAENFPVQPQQENPTLVQKTEVQESESEGNSYAKEMEIPITINGLKSSSDVEEKKENAVELPQEPLIITYEPERSVEQQESEATNKTEIESSPESRRKNWWEVERKSEVMAIEDLDGDMHTFERHVERLGVAKKDSQGRWIWTGDDKKLVFLGDILGDRQMDGIQITNTIFDLADQAEKQGGQVDFLCGNHDIFFITFLGKKSGKEPSSMSAMNLTKQSMGLWEISKFDSYMKNEKIPSENMDDEENRRLWTALHRNTYQILNNMRDFPESRKFLEKICRLKIAIVHDDTLFCHTDPTEAMVADLTATPGNIKEKVDGINLVFQNNLRKLLLESSNVDDDFRRIIKLYLGTGNRVNFTEHMNIEDILNDLYGTVVIQMNDDDMKKGIKDWKNKNNVEGEYFELVKKIYDEYRKKKRNIDVIGPLQDKLRLKIENLNSFEDENIYWIEKLRDSGVNSIIHGHTPTEDRFFDRHNFTISSPHAENGISTIQKNGMIDFFGKSIRNKKP